MQLDIISSLYRYRLESNRFCFSRFRPALAQTSLPGAEVKAAARLPKLPSQWDEIIYRYLRGGRVT